MSNKRAPLTSGRSRMGGYHLLLCRWRRGALADSRRLAMTHRDLYLRALADLEADLARCTDPLRYRKKPWFPRQIHTEWARFARAACWRLRRRLYGKEKAHG